MVADLREMQENQGFSENLIDKSEFVERKGKPVEEEKLFDGFLMSKYFLMRHCLLRQLFFTSSFF